VSERKISRENGALNRQRNGETEDDRPRARSRRRLIGAAESPEIRGSAVGLERESDEVL
jgi:hypothetical protein